MEIKPKIRKLGVICFILTGFILFSCQKAAKKASEEMMDKSIENATGKKTDVDINKEKAVITSGENKVEVDASAHTWPKEVPADVPKFNYGKINAVTTAATPQGNSWTIIYKEVPDGVMEKYEAELKKKGFTTTLVKSEGKGMVLAQKEKLSVNASSGEGNAGLSIVLAKE